MRKIRLFITGMGGMTGRSLAGYAVKQNYSVAGTINKTLPDELATLIDNGIIQSYKVDLSRFQEIKRAIIDYQPDVVIHLAGRVLGREHKKVFDPQVFKENTIIFKNLIRAIKALSVRPRLVLVSGCLVYDKLTSADFIQEIPIQGLPEVDISKFPYRASRIAQERLLTAEKDLDYVIVRPTQLTGPGKISGVVEYYVAKEIAAALKDTGKKVIEIGNKLGEVDLIDVRDAVRGLLVLAEKGLRGEIYHLSSGSPVSVEKLVKIFLVVAGLDSRRYRVKSLSQEQTVYFRFSPDKLKNLGWKMEFSLEQALTSYFNYFKTLDKQMNNKSLAQKVDILIPTHNRPEYLKRVLDYYQKYGKDFNFVITDSSSLKNKTRNKKIVAGYPELKINYKSNFPERLVQSLKFGETVKLARSKYCVFCGDDDFIVPSAIYESVKFLEENPDYVAAHGTYIGFQLFRVLSRSIFRWRFRYTPLTIAFSPPIKRLDFHLRNYVHLIWSVRRTEVTKIVYKEFFKARLDPQVLAVMGELLPDSLMVLFGKVKALNIFFGARQYFGSIISHYPTLLDAKISGIYDREYLKYKKSIIKNLNKPSDKNESKNAEVLDLAFEAYNQFSYQEHLMNKINLVFGKFPRFAQSGLRILHSYYLFSKRNNHSLGKLDETTSRYYFDFKNIKNEVLFHIK